MGGIDKPSIDKLLCVGVVWSEQVPTCLHLPKDDPEGTARAIIKCAQIFMVANGKWVKFSTIDGELDELGCLKNCGARCLVAQLAWR
jgi:hypothetical protein